MNVFAFEAKHLLAPKLATLVGVVNVFMLDIMTPGVSPVFCLLLPLFHFKQWTQESSV